MPYNDVVVVRPGIPSSQGRREVGRLFSDAKVSGSPAWAPDGRRLVFSSMENEESWLLVGSAGVDRRPS
jgi:Tol biopolymer transport system component